MNVQEAVIPHNGCLFDSPTVENNWDKTQPSRPIDNVTSLLQKENHKMDGNSNKSTKEPFSL